MSNTKQIEAITIRADILKRALKAVIPAMSKDQTRPHLCGAHLVFGGRDLLIEATDGHVAHRVTIRGVYVDGDRGLWHSLIIPADAVKGLLKILPRAHKKAEATGVVISRGGASCGSSGVTWEKIKSQFPPMSAVIPDRSRAPGAALVGVNPDYMMQGAKACAAFRDGSAHTTSMRINMAEDLDPILMYLDDSLGNSLCAVVMPIRF
jgi:hypothetical protein